MLSIGAALLLAAASPAPQLSGDYETSQMEMAGGLRLGADGIFLYVFDYGAVSEMAQGTWSRTGDGVRLTSSPRPASADPERSWAPFRDQSLRLDGESLLLGRYDTIVRFVRVRP